MTIAQQTLGLLTLWGAALTGVRASATYDDTGAPTKTWATQASFTGDVQPVSGAYENVEQGDQEAMTHRVIAPNGTDLRGGDRVRTATWAAGDDEYEIRGVEAHGPSHTTFAARLVRGHGG